MVSTEMSYVCFLCTLWCYYDIVVCNLAVGCGYRLQCFHNYNYGIVFSKQLGAIRPNAFGVGE